MLNVVIWILFAAAIFALVLWSTISYRVHRMMQSRPTVRRGLDLPLPPTVAGPAVSVIVPAHNEERVIDACATGLRAQRDVELEMIFVLDRCSDRTREILDRHAADDDRVTIIENDSCPDDWAGKCNAARLGAAGARGAALLFTDADTEFSPDLIRASLALAHDEDVDLLSILSTLTHGERFERIAQPVASMSLVQLYPIERVNRGAKSRPFANGQFLLFRRTMYEELGGHEAVKDDLLEDIAFARHVHEQNGRCGIFFADGMLRCSMYSSYDAFRQGWKRIFIEACKRKPDRLRKHAFRALASGVIVPLLQIAGLAVGIWLWSTGQTSSGGALILAVLAGWFAQLFTVMRIYALGGAPLSAAFMYPFGCWSVAGILLEAARDLVARRPVRWGGREYVLEPR